MPVYFAQKEALKESFILEENIALLGEMIEELNELYPFVYIEAKIGIDQGAASAYFKNKYTYVTNLTFAEDPGG